jgi:hypothetical protein
VPGGRSGTRATAAEAAAAAAADAESPPASPGRSLWHLFRQLPATHFVSTGLQVMGLAQPVPTMLVNSWTQGLHQLAAPRRRRARRSVGHGLLCHPRMLQQVRERVHMSILWP